MSQLSRSPRRSRIAHFKTPFLVTVAAPIALGMGCGSKAEGTAEPTPIRGETPSPGGPCDENIQCNPPPPQGCEGPAPVMETTWCGTRVGECIDGEWVIPLISCNPPPPERDCPVEVPASGDSCAQPGQTCEYEYCYEPRVPMVTCSERGVWEALPVPTCNPPPPCDYDSSCEPASVDAGMPPSADAGPGTSADAGLGADAGAPGGAG